jgi:hypothetical protein
MATMWIFAVVFSLFVSLAHASEPVKVNFQLLSPGEEVVLAKGKARCYFLPEWLELAKADSELVMLRDASQNLNRVLELYQQKVKKMEDINKTLESDKTVMTTQNESLSKNVTYCQAQLDKCGSSAPWIVALAGGFIGVVGIAFAVGTWLGGS